MSRIGNKPIKLGAGTTVDIKDRDVTVKGKKDTLSLTLPELIDVEVDGDTVLVKRANESRKAKSNHGLARTLVNNMVVGVDTGFTKQLEIRGVGYRAAVAGNSLSLTLGFSHPVDYPIPAGITVTVEKNVNITVTGADKQLVGQVAAEIRAYRKPDAYKGKGVRYVGEYVIQKEGKTA
ncbi:MAG: 50S ribosomal protein L6 [Lentisphaeria bacterium]|nr:50S ribosomal protein L6 [Lentisphaeria bacterium]